MPNMAPPSVKPTHCLLFFGAVLRKRSWPDNSVILDGKPDTLFVVLMWVR